MTGGSWKDTDVSHGSKKPKTKRPSPLHTIPHAHTSSNNAFNREYTKFRTEVDLADLQIKLRRWNFARSWRTASSGPSIDESDISPRTRFGDVEDKASRTSKRLLTANHGERKNKTSNRNDGATVPQCTTAEPTRPLDRELMTQYLDRCIAATESQLADARHKAKRKGGTVKEIERLVENVVKGASLLV